MRKLVIVAACSLGALVGVATPAHAKGPMIAVLEAPGAAPVLLRPGGEADDPFYEIQEQVGYWTAMSPAMGTDPAIVAEPTGDLGPMVRLTWDQPEARAAALGELEDLDPEVIEHHPPSLVQEVYPWAEGGPVAFVAGGQETFEVTTVPTWYRIDADVATTLADLGVGDRAALAAGEPLGPVGSASSPPVEPAAEGDPEPAAATESGPANRPRAVGPDPVTDDGLPWALIAGGAVLATAAVGGGGAWAKRRRDRASGVGADAGLPPTGAAA